VSETTWLRCPELMHCRPMLKLCLLLLITFQIKQRNCSN